MSWQSQKRKVIIKYIKHCYREMYRAYVILNLAIMTLVIFALLGLLVYTEDFWGLLMLEAECLIFGYFCWRSIRFYRRVFIFLHTTYAEGKTVDRPQPYRHGGQPIIVDILMIIGAIMFVLSCDTFCHHWCEKFNGSLVIDDIAIVVGVIIVAASAGILVHDYFERFPNTNLKPEERL